MRMRSTCVGNTPCLVAALLVGAAGSVPARTETPVPTLSSIRVTGDARVTAKPDRVQIDVGVTTRAMHTLDAAAESARQVETMLATVRRPAGPGTVLKTIAYSLNPTYQYHPKSEEPTLTGYN